WHFSNDDRISRLRDLLATGARITVADMEALQLDVYMPSAVALRDLMLAQLDRAGRVLTPEQDATAAELRDWDGHYHADSRGALAFELVSF
ncbi:MAG: penicillin acylase family protein, partial [Alphaproteobacteria bacterium]|nr:penicillin acylase family protein [Alphaproteobacteria bacterium]